MPRLAVNAHRDLEKPVVDVDPNAPRWWRWFAWLLRGYLIFVIFATVIIALAGVITLVVMLSS